ncbi:syndecan-like [Agrilus planipennis]|uniref:Syndecan n=1 Tax=Agrilus planipennis TaxID=224129 RepID=A0A7F5R8Q7_AGRPL|nr:syndecan-like [Agrilus planipennis]
MCTIILQSSTDRTYNKYNDAIDIDDELDGSGGGSKDGLRDRDIIEASGSGNGPIDDDDEDHHQSNVIVNARKPPVTTEPPVEKNKISPVETVIPREYPELDTDVIMNPKPEDQPTSFFAQPGILAAVIGGAVVGLLCAILVVMFIVYRMRKKDEGSYALDEPKRSPTSNSYSRGTNKEFFA